MNSWALNFWAEKEVPLRTSQTRIRMLPTDTSFKWNNSDSAHLSNKCCDWDHTDEMILVVDPKLTVYMHEVPSQTIWGKSQDHCRRKETGVRGWGSTSGKHFRGSAYNRGGGECWDTHFKQGNVGFLQCRWSTNEIFIGMALASDIGAVKAGHREPHGSAVAYRIGMNADSCRQGRFEETIRKIQWNRVVVTACNTWFQEHKPLVSRVHMFRAKIFFVSTAHANGSTSGLLLCPRAVTCLSTVSGFCPGEQGISMTNTIVKERSRQPAQYYDGLVQEFRCSVSANVNT